MKFAHRLSIVAAAVASIANCAAAPIGLDISEAQDFNLLTWGNATLINSDTEGRVAVGGNATFGGYSIGNVATLADPLQAAFAVGGNLTAGHGSVAKGSIYVGGSYQGPGYNLNTAGGSTTQSGLGRNAVGIDFDAAEAALSRRSVEYGTAAETGTSEMQWSTLTLSGLDPLLNIFNITAAELAAASTLQIFVPNLAKALINVSGTVVQFSNKGIQGNFAATETLFNFHEAQTLSMSSIGIIGSVLAPFADVNFQSGQMNGQLIAKSFAGAQWGVGELHHHTFNSDEPEPGVNVPDAGPSALLLGGALGLLLVVRRWTRRAREEKLG